MTWQPARGWPPAIPAKMSDGSKGVKMGNIDMTWIFFPLVGLDIMPSLAALAGLPSLEGLSTLSGPPPPPSDGASKGASGNPLGTSSSSISITNLLPFAGDNLRIPSVGVYIGDGIPPVPDKLATKIRKGEFVEMGELLPEFWSLKGEDGEPSRDNKPRKIRKVMDIFTWLQCFGAYVSVRATQAPHLIPEFMAYMATIVRVSQDYSGLAWVRYDAAFHRQAALTNNTRWSVINSTLYTMCFTGMASRTKRCELCFATSHTERERAQWGDPDPDMRDRLKAIESAVLAISSKSEATEKAPPIPPPKPSREPCRKWNAGSCTYPRCRHTHACSSCGGPHPVLKCPSQGFATAGPQLAGKHFRPQSRPY